MPTMVPFCFGCRRRGADSKVFFALHDRYPLGRPGPLSRSRRSGRAEGCLDSGPGLPYAYDEEGEGAYPESLIGCVQRTEILHPVSAMDSLSNGFNVRRLI